MVQLWTENEYELLLRLAESRQIAVRLMQLSHARDRIGDEVLEASIGNRRPSRPEVDVRVESIHEATVLSHPEKQRWRSVVRERTFLLGDFGEIRSTLAE